MNKSDLITSAMLCLASLAFAAQATRAAECETSSDPSRSPDCQHWNNPVHLDQEVAMSRDLDQLMDISRGNLSKLKRLADKASPGCKINDPEVTKAGSCGEEHAILAQVKCQYFANNLSRFGACYRANGIHAEYEPPADWNGENWSGQMAWNQKLSVATDEKRCTLLKQALNFAIAKLSTTQPSYNAHSSENRLIPGARNNLFIANPPDEKNIRDRLQAAWALRYLRFTLPQNVPAQCASAYQEGQYRWAENFNLWHQWYPQVNEAGAADFHGNPKKWGRQPLGFAYCMCGRSNNAHWVDAISQLKAHNLRHPKPSEKISIDPEIARYHSHLERGNDPGRDYKEVLGLPPGPQDGHLEERDWVKFMENSAAPPSPSIFDSRL